MICFSRHWLRALGVDIESVMDGGGLATSPLFSFGGGGGGARALAALEAEIEPRTLILVGSADRYGAGAERAAAVTELCVDPFTDSARLPTHEERAQIVEALAGCSNLAAAQIRAALERM